VFTEGEAASDAGMVVVLVTREGNAELSEQARAKYPVISEFELNSVTEAEAEEGEAPAKKIKLAEEEQAKPEESKDAEMKEVAEEKKVSNAIQKSRFANLSVFGMVLFVGT